MEQLLRETTRIARQAGAKIKALRDEGALTEDMKYGVELVTNADLISNDLIKNEIHKLWPDHVFLSEEDAERVETLDQPTWVIDPIDGTVNYANGHFMAAVSIAYAEGRKVRAGVVYNPFLDELFCAATGAGAYLNDKRIWVKDTDDLGTCLVATGFPYVKDDVKTLAKRIERILPHIRDIRRLGSAALDICWVACGRLQGFYEARLSPWDIAAAKLIAREAGATVGYFRETHDGIPESIRSDHLIITSPKIFDALRELLE